jgi:hypothetical protein
MDPPKVPNPTPAFLHLTPFSAVLQPGLFDQGIHVAFLSQLCNALPEAQGQLPFNQKQGDILCISDPATNIDVLRTLKCPYSLDVNFTGLGIDVFEQRHPTECGLSPRFACFPMGHPSF